MRRKVVEQHYTAVIAEMYSNRLMPSALPEGEAVPPDGSLPASALTGLGSRPFGVYLHVPFCATRCGYCDFNTYTAVELGGGASQASYASTAVAEVRLARQVLGTPTCRPQPCSSVAARPRCCHRTTWP